MHTQNSTIIPLSFNYTQLFIIFSTIKIVLQGTSKIIWYYYGTHVNNTILYAPLFLSCSSFCFCIDVRYKLLHNFANWLEITEDTGLIRVRSSLDREALFIRDEQYTVLVVAYDNGNLIKYSDA